MTRSLLPNRVVLLTVFLLQMRDSVHIRVARRFVIRHILSGDERTKSCMSKGGGED